jgi:hypothetical protein
MRGGHVDAVSRTAVSGWAADSDVPDERCELLIEVNGLEVGRARADRPRRDLAALGRYGDGAHGFTFTFATPLAPEREHDVCVYFDDGTLLPGGVRPLPPEGGSRMPGALSRPASPAPERNSSAMAPILVTAPGRSGTTYLMSCLAASPQIVVAELVPYEVRLMSYYAAAFSVLTAPADPERSTHPDRLEGDGFHIGFTFRTNTRLPVWPNASPTSCASTIAAWPPTRLRPAPTRQAQSILPRRTTICTDPRAFLCAACSLACARS